MTQHPIFTDEHDELRQSVRRFVDTEIRPHVDKWEDAEWFPDDVFRRAGFAIAEEAFADRRYEPDGSLRSRKFADALILDPKEAAAQALRIAENGSVIARDGTEIRASAQTICIHGDTPGAAKIAAAVAQRLTDAGIALRPLAKLS